MKQNIIEHIARGADNATISSFFMSFLSGIFTIAITALGDYSGEIGAACTILSLCCMIFFGVSNLRKLAKSEQNSEISAKNSEISARNSENIEKLTSLFNSKFTHLEQTIKSKGDSNAKRNPKQ